MLRRVSQAFATWCHRSVHGGCTWPGPPGAGSQPQPAMTWNPKVDGRPPCIWAQMPKSPEGHLGHTETPNPWSVCTTRGWEWRGASVMVGPGLWGRHQAGVERVGPQREAGPTLSPRPLPGPAGTANSAPFLRAKSSPAPSVQVRFSRTCSCPGSPAQPLSSLDLGCHRPVAFKMQSITASQRKGPAVSFAS